MEFTTLYLWSWSYFSFLLFCFLLSSLVHCILTWQSFVPPKHKGGNIWGVINFLSLCLFCFSPYFLSYSSCPDSLLKQQCTRNHSNLPQIQTVVKHAWYHTQILYNLYLHTDLRSLQLTTLCTRWISPAQINYTRSHFVCICSPCLQTHISAENFSKSSELFERKSDVNNKINPSHGPKCKMINATICRALLQRLMPNQTNLWGCTNNYFLFFFLHFLPLFSLCLFLSLLSRSHLLSLSFPHSFSLRAIFFLSGKMRVSTLSPNHKPTSAE